MNGMFYDFLPHVRKTKLAYPVDVSTAKEHLRVEHDAEDAYIEGLVQAATEEVENYVHGDIALTSNHYEKRNFVGGYVDIRDHNVDPSTVSVTDGDGNPVGVNYVAAQPSSLKVVFPRVEQRDLLQVDYSTGYTDAELAKPVKQAILIRLTDFYDVRGTLYEGGYKSNRAFESLLNNYKNTYF